ncbi:MAG TPA: hypothetical protein VMX33_06885 [bacterium]|nr:hypothetical protein [bacterium]
MKKVLALACVLLLALPAAFAQSRSLDALWTASAKSYPASGKFSIPKAWAPGQYVVVGQLANGKRDSITTTLVVAKVGNGWVIENYSIDKSGKESVMQMLLGNYDTAMKTGDASQIELVWIKTLEQDGSVTKTEGQSLIVMKALMKSTYEKMIVNIPEYTDGGSIQVPAGTFAATTLVTAKTKVFGRTIESETWFQPAVPVNGMVRSRTKDGKSVSELLGFGFDGKPRIP